MKDIQKDYARESKAAKEELVKARAKAVIKRPARVQLGRMIRLKLHARRRRFKKRTVYTQVDV